MTADNSNKQASDNNDDTAAAKNVTFILVPTKTYDGGAASQRPKRLRRPVRKEEDPFMYYSHQETWTNAVRLRGENSGEPKAIANDNHNENVVRKTKITFELHPSLLLEDLFL